MPVVLSYAMQNGKYIHITDKIQKDIPLYCPHCNDGVIAKKGAKMQHHFAHKPFVKCTATAETLLHFESKMYLKTLILNKTPVVFETSLSLLDEKVRRWYALLGNQRADISLVKILSAYGIRNAMEETGIIGYIPDILGVGDVSFAFEIYVTHALEEKKIEAFKRAHVDYIELIPTREEDGTFSYQVHDAHLPRFYTSWVTEIEEKFEQTIQPKLYEEIKENEAKLTERIKQEMKPIITKEVCETLERNIETFYFAYGEKLSRTQENTHTLQVETLFEEAEVLRLKEAYVRPGKNGLSYLVLRDEFKRSFTLDGTIPLFAELLNELNNHYEVHIITNEKGNIDGLKFINTLDKIGFNEEIKQLLKRNLQIMRQHLDEPNK